MTSEITPAAEPIGRVAKANVAKRAMVIEVEVPTKLSRTEEDLLRRFAEERGESVVPPDQSLLGRIKSAFR